MSLNDFFLFWKKMLYGEVGGWLEIEMRCNHYKLVALQIPSVIYSLSSKQANKMMKEFGEDKK